MERVKDKIYQLSPLYCTVYSVIWQLLDLHLSRILLQLECIKCKYFWVRFLTRILTTIYIIPYCLIHSISPNFTPTPRPPSSMYLGTTSPQLATADCRVANPYLILPSIKNTPSVRVPIHRITRIGQIAGDGPQIDIRIPERIVSSLVTSTHTNPLRDRICRRLDTITTSVLPHQPTPKIRCATHNSTVQLA